LDFADKTNNNRKWQRWELMWCETHEIDIGKCFSLKSLQHTSLRSIFTPFHFRWRNPNGTLKYFRSVRFLIKIFLNFLTFVNMDAFKFS
jgi:hypothetical protein